MLSSGYYWDDSLNSLTRGLLLEKHTTLYGFIEDYVSQWVHGGRFFPLSSYTYALFVVSNLFSYKLFVMVLTLADILLLGYLVKIITDSDGLALLTCLLTPILFQFRTSADPILGFGALLPLVLLTTILSLIFLTLFLKGGARSLLALSLVFYLLGLWTYEITYTFFLLHLVIIIFFLGKKAKAAIIRTILPFAGLSLFSIMIAFSLRFVFNVPVNGGTGAYVPNFNVSKIFLTWLRQTSATFPMTFTYRHADLFQGFLGFMKARPLLAKTGTIIAAMENSRRRFQER